jgi:putative PIN family toxin of toxin-antitoxin system
MSTGL